MYLSQHQEFTHKPEANLMARVQIHCTPSGTQSGNYQMLEYAEVVRHLDLLLWLFSFHPRGGSNTRKEIKTKNPESIERCSICLIQWHRGLYTCMKSCCRKIHIITGWDQATFLTKLYRHSWTSQVRRRCSSSGLAAHTPAAPKHNTEAQQPLECPCRINNHRQHNHQYYYFFQRDQLRIHQNFWSKI